MEISTIGMIHIRKKADGVFTGKYIHRAQYGKSGSAFQVCSCRIKSNPVVDIRLRISFKKFQIELLARAKFVGTTECCGSFCRRRVTSVITPSVPSLPIINRVRSYL